MTERKRRSPRTGTYTRELATAICDELAAGRSLKDVCAGHGVSLATVHAWVIDDHDGFGKAYARAKHLLALHWAEELDEIASDGRNDWYVDDEGKLKPDHEHIARSKLRIDTRKWMLAKMLPKVFGDKVVTEITGANGGAIEMQATKIDVLALEPEQRDQLKQILLAATKGKTEDET